MKNEHDEKPDSEIEKELIEFDQLNVLKDAIIVENFDERIKPYDSEQIITTATPYQFT